MRLKRIFFEYWYVLISIVIAFIIFIIPESKASSGKTVYCTNHEYKNKIYVYVDGAVVIKGKVFLYEGSTIANLLEACKLNDKASTSNLKLDELLVNGKTYTINSDSLDLITVTNHTTELKEISVISKTVNNVSDLVNINTASKEILMTLSNIGNVRANSIISYREKQKFEKIEDIINVSGITKDMYDEIKNYITC